jgi:hypothetical protein
LGQALGFAFWLLNPSEAAARSVKYCRTQTRFAMLSTAWSRTDPFWTAWAGDDQSWIRLKATADEPALFTAEFLEQERHALGEDGFKREYLGIPAGAHTSPFSWDLYARAARLPGPTLGAAA